MARGSGFGGSAVAKGASVQNDLGFLAVCKLVMVNGLRRDDRKA